jgi:hypothetical protein
MIRLCGAFLAGGGAFGAILTAWIMDTLPQAEMLVGHLSDRAFHLFLMGLAMLACWAVGMLLVMWND